MLGWLVQIMKKEGNKTTTTTNTSYSIPTSFVGTAYQWVHVKDVGMEYDVFVVVVVVVVLFPSFFIICTSHPKITLHFEEMLFSTCSTNILCTWVWHAIQLSLLAKQTPATRRDRPAVRLQRDAARARKGTPVSLFSAS